MGFFLGLFLIFALRHHRLIDSELRRWREEVLR